MSGRNRVRRTYAGMEPVPEHIFDTMPDGDKFRAIVLDRRGVLLYRSRQRFENEGDARLFADRLQETTE